MSMECHIFLIVSNCMYSFQNKNMMHLTARNKHILCQRAQQFGCFRSGTDLIYHFLYLSNHWAHFIIVVYKSDAFLLVFFQR